MTLLPFLLLACDEPTSTPTSAPASDPDPGQVLGDPWVAEAADNSTSAKAQGDAAMIIAAEVPAHLGCGAPGEVVIEVANVGRSWWRTEDLYGLGVQDDGVLLDLPDSIALPEDVAVAPGESWTFTFSITAPEQPGVYELDWRMIRTYLYWFGETTAHTLTVDC